MIDDGQRYDFESAPGANLTCTSRAGAPNGHHQELMLSSLFASMAGSISLTVTSTLCKSRLSPRLSVLLSVTLTDSLQPRGPTTAMGSSSWFIRDLRKRFSARDVEVQRRALLYVARNTTLSAQIRHKAQLSLNALNGGEGRMTSIRNRCVETGKGQGEYRFFGVWSILKSNRGGSGDCWLLISTMDERPCLYHDVSAPD